MLTCLLLSDFELGAKEAAGAGRDEIRVLFVGDSLTAGYGLLPQFSYPNVIEEIFRSEGLPVKVINAGVSGDTTLGGMRRLTWQLKSKPHLVVIALGGNDMLRGLGPEQTKANLATMIEQLQARHLHVSLLGMRANPTLGKRYEKSFNSIFSELAEEFKIALLDFYIEPVAGKPDLNLRDGIHPNQKGQEILANKIAKFLKPQILALQNSQTPAEGGFHND